MKTVLLSLRTETAKCHLRNLNQSRAEFDSARDCKWRESP